MVDADLHWLAGLLEGEGSFVPGPPSSPTKPMVMLQMTDEDVVRRVADLFGNSVVRVVPRKQHHKVIFTVRLRGRRAVELMHRLRPLMGVRRQAQIDRAMASFRFVVKHRANREMPTTEQIKAAYATGISMRAVGRLLGVDVNTVKARLQK